MAVDKAHMPPEQARGFCNRRHEAVLGKAPGQEHPKGRSDPPRIDWARLMEGRAMSTHDADGLDASWDGDLSDLPDLTGLGPDDFDAADDSGDTVAASDLQRAAALGSGSRFKALKAKLAAKGARSPGALAAWIGRKKYGKAKFAALAGKARKRKGKAGRSDHPVPDLDVIRTGPGLELNPDDGVLGTLSGRFTEFGRWYKVRSVFEGDFLERVEPGATIDTIRDDRDSMRVLFDHGMDHAIGNKVLGPIGALEEKRDGPRYEVPLFDTSYNRDLLPGLKAGVYGASMRMRVLEFGPVTFPANPGATAGMRSATDDFYGRMAEHNPAVFAEAVRAAGLSLEDFTGRDGARSVPGGDPGGRPGDGRPSHHPSRAALQRDRAWRMRGIR